MQHMQVQQNENSVNIFTLDGFVTIGSQYSPPSTNLEDDLQDWVNMKGMSDLFLHVDDFAHNKLWGYPLNDYRGHHLITQMAQKRVLVANDRLLQADF